MISRLGPSLSILLVTGPVLVGLLWTFLPAFGYLPALGGETLGLEPFQSLFAQPGLLRSCLLSLFVGLASGALSLVIVMLFTAAWSGTRAFARLQRLLSPLLAIPHAATAFGLAFLIAPSGLFVRIVSPELTGWTRPPDVLIVNDSLGLALVAGLVLKEVPFLFLLTLAALPQADAGRARAVVAALGYGRMTGFLAAIWPQLYRQIRLGVFAVIAFSTSVVDVPAILGPTSPPVLAQRLTQWMNDPDLSMRFMAAAGAVLQLALTLAALLAWLGVERLASGASATLIAQGSRWRRDRLLRQLVLVLTVLLVVATFAGLATLALWSVSGLWTFPQALPQSFTLRGWSDVLPRLVRPLTTTLIVALASAALALVLAILCLRNEDRTGRRAGSQALWLIYLPLIVPQVAFLFGLQLLFLSLGATANLGALVLVHLVFVLPYTFLSLADSWRAFDRHYEQVAAGLGRSGSAAFWRIRLPMLLRSLLTAFAIGLAVSIGLYLPTVLIGAGRLTTITTEAVALAAGGNRRTIGIWAFVQMALPFAGFFVATLVPALIFRRFGAMRV